jgi:hypothetical protein
MAGFLWIEWQPSYGLGGRHPWNMHPEIAHVTYRLTALKREKKLGGFCTVEQCLLGVLISTKIY